MKSFFLRAVKAGGGVAVAAFFLGAYFCGVASAETVEMVGFPAGQKRKVLEVPYVAQKPDFCGEACIEMATGYRGKRISQDAVNDAAKLRDKRGVHADELEKVIKKLGLPTRGLFLVKSRKPEAFGEDVSRLVGAIDRGNPVILGVWSDPSEKQNPDIWAFDHFVLLVGYDLRKRELILHDPVGDSSWRVPFADFVKLRKNRFHSFYSIELPASGQL